MNLLPVIYASLLIFGSFFLIVLVTSYITYKVKQYNGGVALATASQKNIRHTMKPVRNNSEKVNIIRRGNPEKTEVLSEEIMPKVQKSIKPEYKREEPQIEMTEKRVSHSESRKPQISRMTRVQDLRSSGSYSHSRTEHFQRPAARDYSTVSQGSMLRYYEDF